jgi:hypothetical protein
MKNEFLYPQIIDDFLPRFFTQGDRYVFSDTFGCFDRNYWHYKTLSEFPSSSKYIKYILCLTVLIFTLATSLNFIYKKTPIFIVTQPGSGPKTWPYMLFENNPNIKVALWPGFLTTPLSPYLNGPAYTVLDDDPETGQLGQFYFKKINPGAKLIKRYWKPGRKAYIDIMFINPKAK